MLITFLQQLINGISQGSAYALIALGYTMVYGVLGLINFAHSDVYMFGAFMGYYIANSRIVQERLGGSMFAAVVVMLLAMALSAGLGMLIERFAYRPGRTKTRFTLAFWLGILGAMFGDLFFHSFVGVTLGAAVGIVVGIVVEALGIQPVHQDSRLSLLIIAIGVSLFLENGGQLTFGADPKFFPEIIPSTSLNVGALNLDTQKLIVLGVSIALMVLLNIVVNYTKTGKAMRAVSYNLDAAKLMGINTDRIIGLTFALGSALAAAGGILVSLLYPKIDPLMGVMPGLKAFVAAVLGGIGNITGAMVGGLILGLAEVMAVGYGSSTYRDAIAFIVLVLILLFKPAGIMGKGTVEEGMKRSAFWIASILVLAGLQMQLSGWIGAYYYKIVILTGINIILAVSLNLINGITGQFSIGHAGFYAIGAYTSASLVTYGESWIRGLVAFLPRMGQDAVLLLAGILVAAIAAALAGVAVGIPSLRLRGDYLAIVTLGFGEIIRVVILNVDAIGGARGFSSIPPLSDFFFFWVFLFVLITVSVIRNLVNSSYGRAFISIRDDEIAAEAMGVDTTRFKVLSFVISSMFAGIGGSLFGHYTAYLNPNSFTFLTSFYLIIMIVVGGLGSIEGSILGAILITVVLEAFRSLSEFRLVGFSILLVLVMLYRPQGLMGVWRLFGLGRRAVVMK